MSTTRFLTGITTTGTPHLGNFVGSIRPSVAASLTPGVQSFYFLADYHALIKCEDPVRIQRSTLEIAASWLAAGLNPEQVTFYRQSDIPEIPELTWLLTCVTGKGVLNRAHAYKASVDKNVAAERDADDGVTAGLFMYPVLMGADILMFKAHKVPVGRDQVQHIEMARDMAASFNHLYGEHFVLPEAAIDEHVATLPGLDGRKMSKSYDNTIPLFSSREQLKKLIGGILTDSRAPGEAKEVEGSALFQIYQAFATEAETAALHGDVQVHVWRRSFDIPPPVLEAGSEYDLSQDRRYAGIAIPSTESLKDTIDRVLPYYEERIAPLLREGQRVLISAHGNSLRALVKHLSNIPDDEITGLEIPTGQPIVYELDDSLVAKDRYYLSER